MHCIIHQEALCAKLSDVMNVVVKTIKLILAWPLHHREFQAFLSEVDAEYEDVTYHSDVRCLSRSTLLQLSDPLWLADLAFWVDLMSQLNTLNKSLQGKDQLVTLLYAHLQPFNVKLRLFETQLHSFGVVHFPILLELKATFPNANLFCEKGEICVGDHISSERTQISASKTLLPLTKTLFSLKPPSRLMHQKSMRVCSSRFWKSNVTIPWKVSSSASPPTRVLPEFGKGRLSSDKAASVRLHIRMQANLFSDGSEQKPTANQVDRQPSLRRSSHLNNKTCQLFFSPRRNITAPTEWPAVPMIGELKTYDTISIWCVDNPNNFHKCSESNLMNQI